MGQTELRHDGVLGCSAWPRSTTYERPGFRLASIGYYSASLRITLGWPQPWQPLILRAPELGTHGSMLAPPSPATASPSASPATASGPPPATRRGPPPVPLS